MKKIVKKSSVATKMILTIVFVTLVVASTTSFIILKQDYKKEMKGVEKVLDDVKSSFMGPLATALYSEDEEQTTSALNGILKLPGLVEVRVILIDEEKAAHTLINPKFKKLTLEQRRALGPSKKIEIIFKEEGEEPESVATMVLYSTIEEAKKKIVAQIINFSIIQLSQVIVLAIAIFLIFRTLVSKHLKSMAEFAQLMDLNDLSGPDLFLKRRKSTSNDELQDLTDSFNEMRNNLKSAHAELKDYAENLEDKVKAATQEIEEEKAKVSNLLNNMQQAVFLVDGNWNVIPPVSHFTSDVFGDDIVGKDVFSTVYKDLDLDSENYADIKSAFSLVYGDDLLQYQIVENNFISRLHYRTKEDEEKILSIKYTPLLNEDDFLETIMFVVDDITEKEKLENEISQKKKESEKNIQLITEMANAELEEIEIFLRNSQMLVQNVLKMAKTAPNDKTVIEEMFRFLHTLKGNSRVFNFNGISQLTHVAENQVMEIKTKIEDGKTMDRESYEKMIKELYGVSKEIMEVSGLAKKVFRIENKYEKLLLTSIFDNIIKIDDLIALHIIEKDHILTSNEGFKKRKLIFEKMKKNPPHRDHIENILNSTHSIKASLKASSSFEKLIENVSMFEVSLKIFDDYKNADVNYFSENFIDNLLEIKDSIKSFYLESDLNRPLTPFPQDWTDVISNLYDISSKINFENDTFDKSIYSDLDNLKNTVDHHNLTLLKYLVNISRDIIKKENWITQNKLEFQSILADFWEYLLVVIKIDSLNFSKLEDFEITKKKIEDVIALSMEENNKENIKNLLKELDKKYLITVLFKNLRQKILELIVL